MSRTSEVAPLGACLLGHPRDVWRDQSHVDDGWRTLGFTDRPDFARACDEYDAFVSLLREAPGFECVRLPPDDGLTLDAIYARDASICTPRGIVRCAMGKEARHCEPRAHGRFLEAAGVPVVGAIEGEGRLEGGDVVWLDERTVAVGIGYRTNAEGCRQLRSLLGEEVDVLDVHLPHWRGPGDVFHLMSILSPIDEDLALAYSPLMPVTFRAALLDRGLQLVEVPEEELEMGPNALAIAPRRCIVEAANVRTRARLEELGVEVMAYEGREISRKGMGGPTCLTRPLERSRGMRSGRSSGA